MLGKWALELYALQQLGEPHYDVEDELGALRLFTKSKQMFQFLC